MEKDQLPTGDEIVISGISGRFPASDNVDEFRDNLLNKTHMVQPKDLPEWKNDNIGVPNFVGQINERNKFDSRFFGISTFHSSTTDPFTRILLEKAFEAIVDSGINPSELSDTNTAVLTGSHLSESELAYDFSSTNNAYLLGHSRALLSNRVSYWLNIHGTSVAVMSMETSGFEALTVAYEELKSGRCDAAIVGCVNMVTFPPIASHYALLGVLSEDGKCRSFDAKANGYARSEAIIAVFLQKARNAKRIYATIVNSKFEQCGSRNLSIATPYGEPLGSLMEHFYDSCGVNPADIQYLEADGCGTIAGDREELKPVEKVLLKDRRTPLLIGSVKSNMGHAIGAANFCSLAKVLIAMQTGVIPPNLHYTTPSPAIPVLLQNRAKVVTENTPWNGGLVALNGISMTGSYAHVLLQSYGKNKPKNTHCDGIPRLIVTSCRTEEGAKKVLKKLESMPVDVEFVRLMHDIYSSNMSNCFHRAYTIVPPEGEPINEIKHYAGLQRPVWFIFSGMGSQWKGMGRELMKLPVCAATIDKCHSVLAEKGLDLKHIITTDDSSIFDSILNCFVGIAAIQLALVDLLRALGIKADGMVGHSVGELGCAYEDGCFTLEQMILAAYYRGQASVQADLIAGFMAAIGIGYEKMKDIIPPEIDVACHNSANNCTISGPVDDVKKFVEELQSKDIFARTVNVANIAYHSRYIQPAGPLLLESLQKLIPDPKPRSSRWLCSSVPQEKWDTPLAQYSSAEYHTNNLLSPVLFEETCKLIPKDAITIEIAPHGLLQAILRQALSPQCTNVSLTRRNHPGGLRFLMTAIGKLYLEGLMPQIKEMYPPVQLPVSRGTPSVSPLIFWDHTETLLTVGDVIKEKFIPAIRKVPVTLNQEEFRTCSGHIINGTNIMPAFAFLKIVWDVIATINGLSFNKAPVVFQNVKFHNYLIIEERGSQTLQLLLQRGSGDFEINSENELLVTGNISLERNIEEHFSKEPPFPNVDIELTGDDFYLELAQQRYQYSDSFRGVHHIKFGSEGCVAEVRWSDDWVAFGDALLQVMMFQSVKQSHYLQLPAKLQTIIINPLHEKSKICDMEAVFHHAAGIMCCGGIELRKLTVKPFQLLTNQQPNVIMETVRFITYCNPNIETALQFTALALQWTIENSQSHVNVAVLEPTALNILMHVKSLLPRYPQITLKSFGTVTAHSLIVATRNSDLKLATSKLASGGFLFISTSCDDKLELGSDMMIIAEKHIGNEKYSLFKQPVLPIRNSPNVLHLTNNTASWLQEIKLVESNHKLFAVIELDLQEVEDILFFIKSKIKGHGLNHVRYVIILDNKAPEFSLNEKIYYKQLQLDLMVNVFYSGKWGSFCHIPADFNPKIGPSIIESQLLSLQSLEDVKVAYLGPNLKDLSVMAAECAENELGSLDFSGTLESGQRLMGIVKWKSRITLEHHLTWNVPESWSLEEAVTVPQAYAIAYLSLIMKAKMKRGTNVLVVAGWSSIGLAAITLALDHNCTVFSTVANQEQKSYLKHQFPQLAEEHIYSYEECFEVYVHKATKGNGVNVILNCFSGPKLQASFRILSSCGCFVQLGQNNAISNESIGMCKFLENAVVLGVTTDDLFNMSSEWRKELHSGIQDGLQRKVINPFKQLVFTLQHTQTALRSLAEKNHIKKVVLNVATSNTNSFSRNVLMSSSKHFYLIIGGKLDQCLDVAEWLASYGVWQVVITIRNKAIPKRMKCRIDLLHSYYGIKLVLIPLPPLTTLSSSQHLLQHISSVCKGILAGLFILPLEPVGQENHVTATTVASLDLATRSITTIRHFVCLLMEKGWSTCERRHRLGLPALSVMWQHHRNKDFSLLLSLHMLNVLFNTRIQNPIIVINEDQTEPLERSSVVPTLDLFLPSSLKSLANFGENLIPAKSSSSLIVELPSLSPGFVNVKEIPPVFLIPGLQGAPCEILKPLARKIMYPTFCFRFVQEISSVTEMAVSLIKHIQEKQKKGPYNLVGISWGGILTLELAKLLEAQGEKTRVILVDGAPETTHGAVQCLQNEDKFDSNLVSKLLHIPESKVTSNWSVLVAESLKEVTPSMKSDISKALTALRSYIFEVLQYRPSGELLKGEVSLIRPSDGSEEDNCGLDQFFKLTVGIHIIEGNHLTIMESCDTARIINDFVL